MEFIEQYAWIAMGIIMVVEYLIGVSKLKSNSIIEAALKILKMIFIKDDKGIKINSKR